MIFELLIGLVAGLTGSVAYISFHRVFEYGPGPFTDISWLQSGENSFYDVAAPLTLVGGVYAVFYMFAGGILSLPLLSHTALTVGILFGMTLLFGAYVLHEGALADGELPVTRWGFLFFVYSFVMATVFHFSLYLAAF